ncbi:Hypothetical predicted protein, partial [Scomber scombrus]
ASLNKEPVCCGGETASGARIKNITSGQLTSSEPGDQTWPSEELCQEDCNMEVALLEGAMIIDITPAKNKDRQR